MQRENQEPCICSGLTRVVLQGMSWTRDAKALEENRHHELTHGADNPKESKKFTASD